MEVGILDGDAELERRPADTRWRNTAARLCDRRFT